MSDLNFVIFHVGNIEQPQLLVNSIRKFNPNSKIFFITSKTNRGLENVTKILRIKCNPKNLMTSRLKGYQELALNEPAIYLDSDVLVVRPFSDKLFTEHDIYLCKRSYGVDLFIDTSFNNMNLVEYENKTFGEIYPYLACFTYTSNYSFWSECLSILLSLEKKFHIWYGDQEALRIISERKANIGYLHEKIICNLPEYSKLGDGSYSIHFKGPDRKHLMFEAAKYVLDEKYFFPE
jgi:hypothetical protein